MKIKIEKEYNWSWLVNQTFFNPVYTCIHIGEEYSFKLVNGKLYEQDVNGVYSIDVDEDIYLKEEIIESYLSEIKEDFHNYLFVNSSPTDIFEKIKYEN